MRWVLLARTLGGMDTFSLRSQRPRRNLVFMYVDWEGIPEVIGSLLRTRGSGGKVDVEEFYIKSCSASHGYSA